MDYSNCIFCYEKNIKKISTKSVDIEIENKRDLILINSLPYLLDISQNASLEYNQAFIGFNQLDFICKNCQKIVEIGGKIQEKIQKLQAELEKLKKKFKKSIEKNAKVEFKFEIENNEENNLRKVAEDKGRKIILNELGYLKDAFQDSDKDSDDGDRTDYDEEDQYFQRELNERELSSPIKNEDHNDDNDFDFSPPPSPQVIIKEECVEEDSKDNGNIDNLQRRSTRSSFKKVKNVKSKPQVKVKAKRIKGKTGKTLADLFFFDYPKDEDYTNCKECGKTFKKRLHYFSHKFKYHGGPKLFNCSVCEEIFGTIYQLEKHRNTAHSEDPNKYHCDQCEKVFGYRYKLKNHTETVHATDSLEKMKCKFCDKTFLHQHNLREHESSHLNPLLCSFCGSNFTYQKGLQKHILKLHSGLPNLDLSNLPKKYNCDFEGCAFGSNSNYDVRRHKNIHTGIKNFICDHCGSGHFNKSDLGNHIKRNHTAEEDKQFICDQCPKRFAIKRDFDVHCLSHKSITERPFKCSICPKSFSDKHQVKNHESCHLNLKNILCDLCSKGFNNKKSLTTHKRLIHKVTYNNVSIIK